MLLIVSCCCLSKGHFTVVLVDHRGVAVITIITYSQKEQMNRP